MGDLTTDETRLFRAWAQSLVSFRPCPITTGHDGCCIAIIEGTVRSHCRDQTLDDLVDRWWSLGKPHTSGSRRPGRARRRFQPTVYPGHW